MKIPLLFLYAFLSILSIPVRGQTESDTIRLKLEFEVGFGNFAPRYGKISMRASSMDDYQGLDPWRIVNEDALSGIPDEWQNAVVQRIWFDVQQTKYQSLGIGSKELSEKQVKLFTHIVLHETNDNQIIYKIDTDNDQDFSDESVFSPKSIPFNIRVDDSLLLQDVHWLEGEVVSHGRVLPVRYPYAIFSNPEHGIIGIFPQYGHTTFEGKTLVATSEFLMPCFRQETRLMLLDSLRDAVSMIGVGEYLRIDGQVYENLGVDMGSQMLALKRAHQQADMYSTQVGFHAIPFEGIEFISEDSISLADFKGRYLYLDFWGTWCGPCVKEIPKLKSVYEQVDKDKVAFLGIARDTSHELWAFLDKEQIPWAQILHTPYNDIISKYHVQRYPTSFLIDDQGIIIGKNIQADELIEVINNHDRDKADKRE